MSNEWFSIISTIDVLDLRQRVGALGQVGDRQRARLPAPVPHGRAGAPAAQRQPEAERPGTYQQLAPRDVPGPAHGPHTVDLLVVHRASGVSRSAPAPSSEKRYPGLTAVGRLQLVAADSRTIQR